MSTAARAGRGLARAAALIAVLTILARIVGFARNIVFANTVGQTCLGQTYQSTNTIPNIVFEVVAGGALASVVVPLISSYVVRGDERGASQIASALMSWTIVVLTPVAVLTAVLARPLTSLILQDAPCEEAVQAGAAMLRIFAPQVVLYGIGIVLTGVLQAYKRFGGPALAPLLSSVVVIAAYLLFAVTAGRGSELGETSEADQLILSVGTTLGVVALALSLVVPLRRTPVRLRPSLAFPPGQAARARSMVGAGLAGLLAQQLFVAITLVLANQPGVPRGAINVFVYAQTIYLLPWAVLAVPIATSIFPSLAESAARGDLPTVRRLLSGGHLSIAALSAAATAALLAAATEIAFVFVSRSPGEPSVGALTQGIIGFSAGLVGYGAFALHSRALFALNRARQNAFAAALGWAVAIATALALSAAWTPEQRVAAMSWANAAGVSVLGAILVVLTARATEAPAARSMVGLLVAPVAGMVIGYGVRHLPLPGSLQLDAGSGIMAALSAGLIRGLLAALLTAALLVLLPGTDLRGALKTVRARRGTPAEETT